MARGFMVDKSWARGWPQIGGGHARISWPNPHAPYQVAAVTGPFSMAPSLLLLAHVSLSRQPERFRIRNGKAHPSAFEKA